MRIVSLGLVIVLGGCTWVSKADVDARTPDLDDDGDGYPKETDCDDDNKNIHPDASETWYDGIDADCGQDDDYDADKDGFVPTIHFGLATAEVKGTGFLSGGDCNDIDEAINPSSVDEWYDGVDTDCAGNDDFDMDADGWVPRTVVYGPTLYAEGTGSLGTGDCDDNEPLVNPGVEDDWYDGIDSNCAGDDDYDADSDGHYRDGSVYSATKYALDTTGDLPGGDCDDTVAEVNPSVDETWYDGVDNDCAGNDDYDADRDGYYKAGEDYGPTLYAAHTGDLPGGDCNDDPDAGGGEANPGTLEILTDGIDHDCDALVDGDGPHSFTLTQIPDISFTGVHDLQIAENSTHIWLVAATLQADLPDETFYDSTWGYKLDATNPAGVDPEQNFIYTNTSDSSYIQTPGMGLIVDDEMVVSALGFLAPDAPSGPKRFFHLAGQTPGIAKPSLGEGAFFGRTEEWPPFSDLSATRSDDGSIHIVGCDNDASAQILNYAYGTRDSLELDEPTFSGGFETLLSWADFSAAHCAIHTLDDTITVYSSLNGLFAAHEIDVSAGTLTAISLPGSEGGETDTGEGLDETGLAAISVEDLVIPGRASAAWAVLVDGATNQIVTMRPDFTLASSVTPSGTPTNLTAVFSPDGTLFISYVLDSGEAFITWGNPEVGFSEPIPIYAAFAIREVALWIDATTGDLLVIGVVGQSDEVAMGIARVNGD